MRYQCMRDYYIGLIEVKVMLIVFWSAVLSYWISLLNNLATIEPPSVVTYKYDGVQYR